MRKALWVLVPALLLGACEGNKQELTQALEQAKAAGAEKDSLLSEVLETTKFINEVNVELAKAKTVGVSPVVAGDKAAMSAKAEERAMVLGKIREVVARLEQAEASLEKTKTRLGQLSSRDARLIKQIDDYKTQLQQLREQSEAQAALIEEQKGQITVLATQVQEKAEENRQLATEKQVMVDSVATITETVNTVYYIAGTKKELKEKGVIVDEGSKFLFFGGRHTVPARSLSPDLFTALNKSKDTVVPLPASAKGYQIVSRHSLDDIAADNLKDGKVIQGDLHITKPDDFWKASNYLILVEN
jgi:ABC-type transporter Mla subunit MlaD